MANLTPITSWTAADVQHFARRAGFGITPQSAAIGATRLPGSFIDEWIDGYSTASMDGILAERGDVVPVAFIAKLTVGEDVPAVVGDHGFLITGNDAWRNRISHVQGEWFFRMQYSPNQFQERLAVFWHIFFATAFEKVDSAILMKQQIDLFRSNGMGNFTDLLVAVSKDAAMTKWLDCVHSDATINQIPNENYAREALELFSLGGDNGYSQEDILSLAKALSGWSFYIHPSDWSQHPGNVSDPSAGQPKRTIFTVYQGQAVPPGSRQWDYLFPHNNSLRKMHPTGSSDATGGTTIVSFLGTTFDYSVSLAGMAPGEHVLRHITVARPIQCSEFLSKRFLNHFVTPNYTAQDVSDFAAVIRNNNFHIGTALKILFKSQYFFEADKRYCLINSPVSWMVQATRMLGFPLEIANDLNPRGFPAWRLLISEDANYDFNFLKGLGFALLNPFGPNGWADHDAWINPNTLRWRNYVASALALKERAGANAMDFTIVPSDIAQWLPHGGPTALDIYNQLIELLQPAPIPTAVRDGWLSMLFGGSATPINSTTLISFEQKIRELVFLILICPQGQAH